ncbi:MAG: phytanoyl-CoA dioxygenase family protein, partial [Acidimicrobiia bacterium]|nr:phytanoyl-CoA dioxygenase family protein [Acidimicrobiia bacterium]
VAHHGALIVRNLLEAGDVRRILEGMHRAQAQLDRPDGDDSDDESASWYQRYPASEGVNMRSMVQGRGGIWMADSPANTALILDLLTSRGVIAAVAGHFGERPCFSLQKSTLRRLEPTFRLATWHQDGAFLGSDVRTMNVWVALSPCGGDRPTPGLEVVPKRVDEILSLEGGLFPNSIAPEAVEEVAADAPAVCPEFEPGDGILFDERFLHRTYFHANMSEDRYALECWLFAPSHRSPDYLPFLV